MKKKLEDYPEMDASRLYGIVKRLGYPGRGDHFRAIVAEIRPKKRAEAYLRLKTLPGEQAQVDWGSFGTMKVGRATRKLSAFAMVLSYSRQLYLKFYFGQGMSVFLAAHQEGFEFLGGCVLDVLYDNLKTAVTERIGPAIRFNQTMLSFSGHYGFNPKPVTIARGNEKGRVERVIQYVRRAFFMGREVVDIEKLNEEALDFCLKEAGDRRHPEDRTMTVAQAWEREKERLRALPEAPYPVEESVVVSVGKTAYVRFDKNDYSVPHRHVGQTLQVLASARRVRILCGNAVVAEHRRSYDQGEQVENPAHISALVEQKQQARMHRGINHVVRMVPQAQEMLTKLAQRGENLGSATAALGRLLAHYGQQATQAAVAEAMERGSVSPHTVRLVLERKRREQNMAPPMEVALPKDSPLRTVFVVPHELSTYDTLAKEDEDDIDDIF
jgi:transposase